VTGFRDPLCGIGYRRSLQPRPAFAPRGELYMDFRMYFLDAKGHIQAARSFSETSYAEAIDFAELLYSLCDDVFMGYEVWRGSAIIYEGKNSPGQPKETLAEVCERRQRLVVEMEEALMDTALARSSFRNWMRSRKERSPPRVTDEI